MSSSWSAARLKSHAASRSIGRRLRSRVLGASRFDQRVKELHGLGRPTNFHQQTGSQLDGSGGRLHPAEPGAITIPQPVEELILLGGVAGITSEAQGKKTQGRAATDRSQQLTSASRLVKCGTFAAGGQCDPRLERIKSWSSQRMLGVDSPRGLERRPSQNQALALRRVPNPACKQSSAVHWASGIKR